VDVPDGGACKEHYQNLTFIVQSFAASDRD
jgi:hypothetical protein